ncbi:MAG: hypothetical protein NW703_04435 [Nitrospiraceae bacterium]
MAGALANVNAQPTVRAILEEALKSIHPSDVDSLLKIAQLQAKAGDRIAATGSLSRAVELAEATVRPDDTLSGGVSYLRQERLRRVAYLLDAASLQAELGEKVASARTMQKAVQTALVQSTKKRSYKVLAQVSALRDVALAQLSIGEKDAATSTIEQAIEIARTLQDGSRQQVRLLTSVAVRLAELGNPELYKATLVRAVHIAKNSEGPERITALADIAAAKAQTGDLESAEKTLESALHTSGSQEEGQSLLPYKVYAQVIVAEGFKEGGDLEAAAIIIRQALEMVELIKDPSTTSIALSNIALAQARLGDIGGAFKSERGIIEETYKGLSFPYIVDAQIAKGDLKAALQTANLIGEHDPLRKEFVLGNIACAYARIGDVEAATTISKQIGHRFRAIALKAVGKAMVKAGNDNQALAWASRHTHALEKAYILMGIAEGLLSRSKGEQA